MASFVSYGCRIWTRRRRRKWRLLPIIAQYIYDGEDLGHPYIQSTTVLCDNTHVHTNTHSTHIFRWLATTNSMYLCRIVRIAHGEGWGTLLCKASARLISSRAKAAFKDTHVQLEGHILLADGVLILKHPQHPTGYATVHVETNKSWWKGIQNPLWDAKILPHTFCHCQMKCSTWVSENY